jgi:hypothetical protein
MSFLTRLPRDRYSRDALARFSSSASGFDLGVARAMVWMCQLAYETDEPAKIADIVTGWELRVPREAVISEEIVTPLPKASTQAIVAFRADAVIVALAGTDPVVLADWVSDFDIGRTQSGAANGFSVAAETVWPRLKAQLKAGPANLPIFVTGHSLGGALAVLIADRINSERVGNVHSVYTIGMPRAGTSQFAAAYDGLLGSRTFRLVHGEDVVPTVAPSFLGFRHVGRHLHCVRQGRFDANSLAALGSDDPPFEKGISKHLKGLLQGPLSGVLSMTARLKLIAALAAGVGPAGMRTDPGGLVIELLPPPLRDHMPDRYIGAT